MRWMDQRMPASAMREKENEGERVRTGESKPGESARVSGDDSDERDGPDERMEGQRTERGIFPRATPRPPSGVRVDMMGRRNARSCG
ncbi:hypothetical protein B0H17DRAFT_1034305 [Mycena rosella]|uniref:Uncharacterized protein n=1 Tax=Mycena rosella TaxID=1033263 RepID=A0AAD7M9L7_MYCRO|nr:hypothetical protein B0H17DRAFT_1034305 [Mycena rosella]